MKIVVLDSDPAFGSSLAPVEARGILELSALHSCGECSIYENSASDQVHQRARDANVILTNKVILGEREFAALPQLKLVSVIATGVNTIDLDAASRRGIVVSNVPGYSTASTAQHTIALLLELTNQVGEHARDVSAGGWEEARAFSYFKSPLVELDQKVMGVVGFGAIGKRVAEIAHSLGMRVLVHTRTVQKYPSVTFVDRTTLLEESDVVSLHCPLSAETRDFIDASALKKMKPTSFLINASRGPVVNETALAHALAHGEIAGAATDVLSQEPPPTDHPLVRSKRCIVTPHIAWATQAARQRLLAISVENIRAFAQGCPQNVVNKPATN